MKAYLLILILTQPDGSFVESVHTRFETDAPCIQAMADVWRSNADGPVAYYDEHGPVPVLDAACVPEGDLR